MLTKEEKQDFIGAYLERKMKGHSLGYGIEYLNKVAKHEDEAEKLWERELKSKITNNINSLKK